MDVPDAVVGKIILVSTSVVFIIIIICINTYPFIDQVVLRRVGTVLYRRPHVLHALSSTATLVNNSRSNIASTARILNNNRCNMNQGDGSMAACKRSDWIVIGISGVTCGGKTSLAVQLRDSLCPVYVFHQDKYFYPDDSPKHVKCKDIPHNNYDILSALDMEQMYKDVQCTLKGEDKSHVSVKQNDGKRFSVKGKNFMIVEGFTVLNYPPILEICDLRYYFILTYSECLSRRVFRLYDPPDVDGYFDTCVWPEHLKYRAQIEQDSRVKLLDGTERNSLQVVMEDLKCITDTKTS